MQPSIRVYLNVVGLLDLCISHLSEFLFLVSCKFVPLSLTKLISLVIVRIVSSVILMVSPYTPLSLQTQKPLCLFLKCPTLELKYGRGYQGKSCQSGRKSCKFDALFSYTLHRCQPKWCCISNLNSEVSNTRTKNMVAEAATIPSKANHVSIRQVKL